ncbi:MAG: hypothetical protein HRU25_18215 [Psychrobium sp.]|nr:hypothetical protein [Psychrobium sp.]
MSKSLLLQRFTLGALLATASSVTFAHSGHDHSAPESNLIHLLWLAPIAIAAIYGAYRIKQNKSNKHNNR